tara:strand:+ start:132 stop:296 length:165 start_codon:yes stop_codon:yes gene_type:complete
MFELFIGLIFCLLLYLLGHLLYPEPSKKNIIPEPNNLLKNYSEAVDMIYGVEEE